jgi:hypothetical protein
MCKIWTILNVFHGESFEESVSVYLMEIFNGGIAPLVFPHAHAPTHMQPPTHKRFSRIQ